MAGVRDTFHGLGFIQRKMLCIQTQRLMVSLWDPKCCAAWLVSPLEEPLVCHQLHEDLWRCASKPSSLLVHHSSLHRSGGIRLWLTWMLKPMPAEDICCAGQAPAYLLTSTTNCMAVTQLVLISA